MRIYKIAQIRGEWWICDGSAMFADGDVGDMNHEAYVIQMAQSELMDGDEEWEEWKAIKALEIADDLSDVADEDKKYELKYEANNDPEKFLLDHMQESGIDLDTFLIANGNGRDPRLFGMKKWKWKRVLGENVQTWNLTNDDLSDISRGLYDAYGDEISAMEERGEEAEFNIEVLSTKTIYRNVPISVIDKRNTTELRGYGITTTVYSNRMLRIYKIAQTDNALFDHFGVNHDQISLADYLSFESEYDIPLSKLIEIAKSNKLRYENFKFAVCIHEGERPYWFIVNSDGATFDYKNDIIDWVDSIDEDDAMQYLGITDGDLYVGDVGLLKEIRENPGVVYHYTNEDALQAIQESGYVGQSWGSGLGNRGAHGLFVSMNPDEYADGTYGNILLAIDLQKFKEENGINALDIDIEPQYKEYIVKEKLVHRLGMEYRGNVPTDISMNTLIIEHNIPLKYVAISGAN